MDELFCEVEMLRFFVFKSIKRHHGNFELDEIPISMESYTNEGSFKDVEKIYADIRGNNKEEVDLIYNQLFETSDVQYVDEFGNYLKNLKDDAGEDKLKPIKTTKIISSNILT